MADLFDELAARQPEPAPADGDLFDELQAQPSASPQPSQQPDQPYAPIPQVQNYDQQSVGVPQATRRGAAETASLLGTVSQYAGERFDSDLLRQQGESMQGYWDQVAQNNPLSPRSQTSPLDDPSTLVDPTWWAENTARMAPSFVAPLGVAGAVGKGTLAALPGYQKLATLFGATAGGGLGGALEGAGTYREGIEDGQDEPTAARAGEAMAAGSAALNTIPFYKILNPSARGVIYNFLSRGLTEGVTEAMEEPLDAIIQGLAYDKDVDWEDVARQAAHVAPGAFLLGGLAGGGNAQAPQSRSSAPEPDLFDEAEAVQPQAVQQDVPPTQVNPLTEAIQAARVEPRDVPGVTPPAAQTVAPEQAQPVPPQEAAPVQPDQVEPVVAQLNATSAGVPRAQMPQIRSNRQPEFIESLVGEGVPVSRGQVRAGDLKATQNDTDPARVNKALDTLRQGRTLGSVEGGTPVVVSSDGHILDGHHRVAAFQVDRPDEQLPAIFVEMPIQDLLQRAQAFAGEGSSGEGRSVSQGATDLLDEAAARTANRGQNIPENIPAAPQERERSSAQQAGVDQGRRNFLRRMAAGGLAAATPGGPLGAALLSTEGVGQTPVELYQRIISEPLGGVGSVLHLRRPGGGIYLRHTVNGDEQVMDPAEIRARDEVRIAEQLQRGNTGHARLDMKSQIEGAIGETPSPEQVDAALERFRRDILPRVPQVPDPAHWSDPVPHSAGFDPAAEAEREAAARTPDQRSDYSENIPDEAQQERERSSIQGDPVTVYTPNNEPIEARYEVVEADELVASHAPDGRPNPSYPAERQPRQRDRAASQQQIQQIARSLNPALLEQSPTTDTGAPIVDELNVVESGNGRVAAIQLAAREGNTQGLKDYLLDNASRFGIPADQVAGMRNPVLVRRRTTQLDERGQQEFARASNVSSAARLAPAEQARVDAEQLTDDDLSLFESGEDGNVLARSNRPFVNRFLERVGSTEASALVDPQGRPNREAVSRMQAAVFQKAYRNDDLVQLAAEEADPDVRNILSALQQAAPAFARARSYAPDLADLDVTGPLVEAIQFIRGAKRAGISVQEALSQGRLFEQMDPNMVDLAAFLDENKRSAKRMGAGIRAMGEVVERELTNRQNESLLGDDARVTTSEIIRNAARGTRQESGQEQGALFGASQTAAPAADGRGRRQQAGRGRAETDDAAEATPSEVAAPPARQPVSDFRELFRRAEASQQSFKSEVDSLADTLGGKAGYPPDGPVKGRVRAREKIEDDYRGDVRKLKDVLRATVVLESPSAVNDAYARLGQHIQLTDDSGNRNWWEDDSAVPASGYRDAKVTFVTGDGLVAELQLNTSAMFDAKNRAHELYQRARTIESNKKQPNGRVPPQALSRIEALNTQQRKVYEEAVRQSYAAERSASTSRSKTSRDTGAPFQSAEAELKGRGGSTSNAQASPTDTNTTGTPSTDRSRADSGSESSEGGRASGIGSTSNRIIPRSPSKNQRGFITRHPLNDIEEAQKMRFARIERALKPILSKVGLAKDVPDAYRIMLRRFRAEVQKGVREAEEVARQRDVLSAEHRKMIADVMEGELAAGIVPPENVRAYAAMMQEAIETQTEELIRLGMLSRQTAERWRGKYLTRYYTQREKPIPRALRKQFNKIDGSFLKGRGMFEMVPKREIEKWKKLGWEIRDPESDTQQVINNLRDNDKVLMWRDYTRAERENMGEIRDAVYRFARGHMETARDIAIGRLFKAIAESDYASPRQTHEEQVQVPNTTIPGTGGVKRYGALADMWVHKDIWNDLEAVRDPDLGGGEYWRQYMRGLSFWKEGKTALNPVVHSNNVWSSWIMADLYGIAPWDVKKYRAALKEYRSKGRFYQEAIDNGLFGTEFYGAEIQTVANELAQFEDLEKAAAGKLRRMIDYGARFSGARAYRRGMGRLYRAEDQFFKLLIFKDMREKGATIDEAIDEAERWIFNYADVPKGVRKIKNSPIGLPFFSYTYKATPALAYAAVTAPWRFIKWMALFGGFNYIAFAALFGPDHEEQEERERKVMPEYMKGMTPFLVQKHIRWPFDRREGVATYLGLERRFPMGDLFDMNNQLGGVGIFQPLMPNNPVFTTMTALVFGKDSFTGRDIATDADSAERKLSKYMGWMYYQFMPNTPLLPFSYSFDKVMNGVANEMGEPVEVIPEVKEYTGKNFHGEEQTLARAFGSTVFGFKIREFDIERAAASRNWKFKGQLRDLQRELRSVARDESLTDAVRERQMKDIRERIDELVNQHRDERS